MGLLNQKTLFRGGMGRGRLRSKHKNVKVKVHNDICISTNYICDRLQENRAQRGVHKHREKKIDRFLKNVLFQAYGRERLGLL